MPGLVLGIIGIGAMFAATVVAYFAFGQFAASMTALGALLLIGLTFWLEFGVFPKSRFAKELSVSEKPGGNQPLVADPAAVIGRDCIALTLMAPGGLVELGGQQYDALCRSGHAARGDRLTVVDVNSFQLVVTKPTNNS